jgi:hypothetical protein
MSHHCCHISEWVEPDGRIVRAWTCVGDPEERWLQYATEEMERERREMELDELGQTAIDEDLLVDAYCEQAEEGETLDEFRERMGQLQPVGPADDDDDEPDEEETDEVL